ncbi:hypothetical protein BCR42DRAFT_427946 [Absidia repens]|uniref:Uncharacterized protein n=1 Tax=Absidia repens TaxID=90262 RepID=A0A1X2HYR9_9FUNG|nr:hypothetical protein BCR42DRAFT_427946 [Absidia repens]
MKAKRSSSDNSVLIVTLRTSSPRTVAEEEDVDASRIRVMVCKVSWVSISSFCHSKGSVAL